MPWHLGHLMTLSLSGAGLVMIESTAVSYDGRITKKDLALYTDEHQASLQDTIAMIRLNCEVVLGLQISHAGRKGSANVPWVYKGAPLNKAGGGWETVAPYALSRAPAWPTPTRIDDGKMTTIRDDYKSAAQRASKVELDCLEIHMAHGYLLHEFLSPISNLRSDQYGGNTEKRARFPLEIASIVRDQWPNDRILGARVTGSDWVHGGITLNDCIYLVGTLKEIGFDYVCVSSGGILPITNRPSGPGYQVHLSAEIKKRINIATRTVGEIQDEEHANQILAEKQADLIGFGRKFIRDPRWLYTAGGKGNKRLTPPNSYAKCLA